jgi:hsp70-interacting protein
MLIIDPEITVRRKTLFLYNTLLPTTPSGSSSGDHTSSSHPAEGQNPIHPNSHAAHLYNPSRASTSQLTLDAFKGHGITSTVITALTNPLPCGEDGEDEGGDVEVKEHGVRFVVSFFSFTYNLTKYPRLLHTYAVTCSEKLSKSEKEELRSWIEQEKGDDKLLADRLGLDVTELRALCEKLI